MTATKKASTTKKTSTKKTAPKKAPAKKTKAENSTITVNQIKSLRLAQNESQSFLLISSDFDGKKKRILQALCSLILLGILATMVYMAVLTNEIAQAVLMYG